MFFKKTPVALIVTAYILNIFPFKKSRLKNQFQAAFNISDIYSLFVLIKIPGPGIIGKINIRQDFLRIQLHTFHLFIGS
jgi:hypothetical protein